VNHVPVFINCRDRVTPLAELLDYLERAGCEPIYLLDNDSTYPPLLEYYEETPHTVIRLGENRGHRWFWESGLLDELGVRGRYVFSDPDTVPIEECPLDAVEYFWEVLDRYPGYKKAGFGLRIDDLPDHYGLKQDVIVWESRFWNRVVAPRLYDARIDTTFALYRGPEHAPTAAIRTGYPYLVRHTTWYLDTDNVPEEHRYYIDRAEGVASWGWDEPGGGPEGPAPERSQRMREKLERFAAQPGGPVEQSTVTVLDSGPERSLDELAAWWRSATPGGLVVVQGTDDERLANLIGELGIPGVFLEHPPGAFLGLKPE
jgi:hypothetical protein